MMDISQMTLEQLKALAYDQLVILNQTQANINVIQAEIKKRGEQQPAAEAPKAE
jgi:hypothetical protein